MIAMIAVTPLLPFAALLAALGFNFTLLCNVPNARAARLGYLAASCTAALALGPRAVAASSVSCRSLCVQQAGALFAFVMRVLEYSLVQDPAPQPRTTAAYVLQSVADTFAPFDGSAAGAQPAAAHRADGKAAAAATAAAAAVGAPVARERLAPAGMPPAYARGRLLLEILAQYVFYDLALTLLKRPGAVGPTTSPAVEPGPWTTAGVVQACGFSIVLYLHFAISYKLHVFALFFAWPALIFSARHHFAAPWLASTMSDLWARWHQLFRTSFLRLAYRPARAWARAAFRPRAAGGDVAAAGPTKYDAARSSARSSPLPAAARSSSSLARLVGPAAERALPVLAVFALSGLVHEYMQWAAFGHATGDQALFFGLHGAAIVVEGALLRALPGLRGSRAARAAWRVGTLAFCVATCVIFMRPWLAAGYHRQFWHPVSPVSHWLLLLQPMAQGADAR